MKLPDHRQERRRSHQEDHVLNLNENILNWLEPGLDKNQV